MRQYAAAADAQTGRRFAKGARMGVRRIENNNRRSIIPVPPWRSHLSAKERSTMTTTHDLKSAGLKATVPRLKIISLFETSKVRHLTAEDVYRQLLAEGVDIGLATVYRVLTQFEQ